MINMSNTTTSTFIKEEDENQELEELLTEQKKLRKIKNHNYCGVLATAYRILEVMCPENNTKHQKFFTISDIGYYNRSRVQIHLRYRENFIEKALKAGIIKEIVIPERIGVRWNNYDNPDIGQIINSPSNKRSLKRLRNSKYYKLTEKGIRIYRNIKEVMDALG